MSNAAIIAGICLMVVGCGAMPGRRAANDEVTGIGATVIRMVSAIPVQNSMQSMIKSAMLPKWRHFAPG